MKISRFLLRLAAGGLAACMLILGAGPYLPGRYTRSLLPEAASDCTALPERISLSALGAAPALGGSDPELNQPSPEKAAFVFRFEAPETEAPYLLVYDATAELLIYEKNADTRLHPASTAKLITAQLTLDFLDPESLITVGDELCLVPWLSSLCDVSRGDVLTVRELLYGLLLPSGNDAAYVLAVAVARKVTGDPDMPARQAADYFCRMMSERAAELGCRDTNFVSPSGWDDELTYSTCRDMLLIARAAAGYPLIREIAATPYYRFTCRSGASFEWPNSNNFLHEGYPFYREEVKGLKTGSTDEAGRCLVTLADLNGHEVYLLIYGSESTEARTADLAALMDAYLDQTVRLIFRLQPAPEE